MKKKILIIGKKGFISSNLIEYLKNKKLKIYSLSFENFQKKYYSLHDKFEYIINCSSNKKFAKNKY